MNKLLMISLLGLFMFSFASAMEIDNTLTYSNNDMKVELKNWFGLGTDYGSVELKSHKDINEIKIVPPGNEVPTIWYEFNWNEDYSNGLGTPEFIDQRTGKDVERNYYFAEYQSVTVDDAITTQLYKTLVNGTEIEDGIKTEVIGDHQEMRWVKLDSLDIKKGIRTIGLIVEVRSGDYIDGIWEIGGRQISKHAIWSADLNNGLVGYWTMNTINSTLNGTYNNITGLYDRVLVNFTQGANLVTGLQSNAINFTSAGNRSTYNTSVNLSNTTWSYNHYQKIDTIATNQYGFFVGTTFAGGSDRMGLVTNTTGTFLEFRYANNTLQMVQANQTIPNNQITMVTIASNGSDLEVYLNASLVIATPITSNTAWGAVFLHSPRFNAFDNSIWIDEIGFWNITLNSTKITNLWNAGAGLTYSQIFGISSISPANAASISSPVVNFSINVTDPSGLGVKNISLLINGIINQTNATHLQGFYNFTVNLPEGFWNWSVTGYDNSTNIYTTSNGTLNLTVNSTPMITVFSPANTTYLNSTIDFNATSTETISKWIVNYNGTNFTLSNINTSLGSIPDGFYHLFLYGNNSVSGVFGLNSSNYFTVSSRVSLNSQVYNASTIETKQEYFYANITTNGTAPTNATLTYNGTIYSANVTNTAGNYYNLTSSLQVPLVNGTKSFNFNVTIGGVNYNFTQQSQTITNAIFVLCNSTYSDDFLNLTFQDELALTTINASVPASTMVYYLGNGSVNKTLSLSNSSNNYNYTFCAFPTAQFFNVKPTFNYRQVSDYPQRTWSPSPQSYNSTVFNQILYLLSITDGQPVTIQVVNPAFEPLEGVLVNVTTVGSGLLYNTTTDAAGSVSFFLNPLIAHTFGYYLTGYDALIETIYPTQDTYTVTLGAVSTSTTFDYSHGINYTITPANASLVNGTVYNFTFYLNSSYWTVTNFGFNLVNSSGSILNTTTATANSGVVYVSHNTTNLSQIAMNYFWIINSTSSNGTRTWIVYDSSGTGFSVGNFFTDLGAFITTGMFGIDNFGLALICFLTIFIGTGIMSYNLGFTNPATVAGTMFFLTLFLNVGIDIIPITNSIRYLPTILMFLIASGVLMWEVSKYG